MNAIALLKADHRAVEDLFEQLEAGPRRKKPLLEKLVRELSIHSAIEEQLFYPEVKRNVTDAKELVLEALEEHNVVKWLLDALESMDEKDARFEAKLKVLRDSVMRHVEEEENEIFPRAEKRLGTARLNELGTMLDKAKRTAPTHPHPRAPDEPPANIPLNMGAAMVDRLRDAARALRHRPEAGGRRTREGGAATKSGATTERGAATRRAGAARHEAAAKRSSASRPESAPRRGAAGKRRPSAGKRAHGSRAHAR